MKTIARFEGLDDFFHTLAQDLDGELRTDAFSKALYATDASIYQVPPLGVLLPHSPETIEAAVALAAKHRIPLLPRGSGSSLAGQAVNEAVVLDFTRHMNAILEINPEERWVRVQPGVVLDHLNAALRPHRLQYGPDPASGNRAVMGGIIGNNASGSHSICYGMSVDHVLELEVVLADGRRTRLAPVEPNALPGLSKKPGLEGRVYDAVARIAAEEADTIRAGVPRHWRRCGGYNLDWLVPDVPGMLPRDPRFNLAKLVCGSEGSLAVITELKLNLVPLPSYKILANLRFDRIRDALDAVPTILETEPSAVELLDQVLIDYCRKVPSFNRLLEEVLPGDPHYVLTVEFQGENSQQLQDQVAHLRTHLESSGIRPQLEIALDPTHQARIWEVRKAGLGLLMSVRGDTKPLPFIEDAAVPVEHLADYVERLEAFCMQELGTRFAAYAHASAGCLHIRPMINAKAASDVAMLPRISAFTVELLQEFGGVLSSEHGDGRSRGWLNEAFFGKPYYDLFAQVKDAFDPERILNPGAIVDAPPMTEHLRFGQEYRTTPGRDHLDFTADHGFAGAVEVCNGAGVCRQVGTGAMCPSFMATREEEHSTRGRANLLRAALSGLLPPEELTSKRMFEAMDLCVECKSCKSECPSSVDMAKLKFEFLARYYEQHPPSLRTRLFAYIATISRLCSGPHAPLVNRLMRSTPSRLFLDRALGISKQRTLPSFTSEPFQKWFRNRPKPEPNPDSALPGQGRSVVLFHDTFCNYNHPEIGRAATELLERLGFEVLPSGHRCCGRPMISKGLFKPARTAAQHTTDCLVEFARAGLPIVGLEPSCILSIRDEYPAMLPNHPGLPQVMKQCFTIEEFLTQTLRAEEVRHLFTEETRTVLVHGHCHQRALAGINSCLQLMRFPRHYNAVDIQAGCCGMAGAFGYEKEHYQVSLKMGEDRLFPAIREASPETLIAASGTSCRQQIMDGTGRKALHPVEVLHQALR